ncbi:hypothetical protein LVW35_13120 [Pseudomonas sp. HN11]|uniref:hypothetical protein n=1 Tax=Pseudomonas sp. HN11 TaxID=1344094 RepID=UPI001F456142|nr:hypothetical protein [Pseudomonas sp. HN11]UII74059.1 hypothetical protein LVW35_13120 [Pseudomonas sp. HN11]
MNLDSNVLPALFNVLAHLNAQHKPLAQPMQAALDTLNSTAVEAGTRMFNLGNLEKAESYLTIGAGAGDVWCQFALATCGTYRDGIWHRERGDVISHAGDETKKWLRLAADQNHIPALIQLGDSASMEKAQGLINDAPAYDQPRGMYYMYLITEDASWLEKSAAAGWEEAQYRLAEFYQRHPERITNSALRAARIEELFQESADGGFPLAVHARIFSDDSTASLTEKQARLDQLARMGQVDAMLEYGYALANMPRFEHRAPDTYELRTTPRTYGLAQDLGLAYAMLKFVLKQTAGAIEFPRLAADLHGLEMRLRPKDVEMADATLLKFHDNGVRAFRRLYEVIIPRTAV